eukprot:1181392-Prorocentrum_minimum.AAC.4
MSPCWQLPTTTTASRGLHGKVTAWSLVFWGVRESSRGRPNSIVEEKPASLITNTGPHWWSSASVVSMCGQRCLSGWQALARAGHTSGAACNQSTLQVEERDVACCDEVDFITTGVPYYPNQGWLSHATLRIHTTTTK